MLVPGGGGGGVFAEALLFFLSWFARKLVPLLKHSIMTGAGKGK
jgi:hypothetical protein